MARPIRSLRLQLTRKAHNLPYSRKIWRGIKFGGLAVYYYNRQIKIRQNFLLAYICMAIPYRTAKFKSANILSIAILGSTAKFNARQYFRLYGIVKIIFTKNVARMCHNYGGARVHKGSMATLSGQKTSSQCSDHLSMILERYCTICWLQQTNKGYRNLL